MTGTTPKDVDGRALAVGDWVRPVSTAKHLQQSSHRPSLGTIVDLDYVRDEAQVEWDGAAAVSQRGDDLQMVQLRPAMLVHHVRTASDRRDAFVKLNRIDQEIVLLSLRRRQHLNLVGLVVGVLMLICMVMWRIDPPFAVLTDVRTFGRAGYAVFVAVMVYRTIAGHRLFRQLRNGRVIAPKMGAIDE